MYPELLHGNKGGDRYDGSVNGWIAGWLCRTGTGSAELVSPAGQPDRIGRNME